jgi:hypothetical protein
MLPFDVICAKSFDGASPILAKISVVAARKLLTVRFTNNLQRRSRIILIPEIGTQIRRCSFV